MTDAKLSESVRPTSSSYIDYTPHSSAKEVADAPWRCSQYEGPNFNLLKPTGNYTYHKV